MNIPEPIYSALNWARDWFARASKAGDPTWARVAAAQGEEGRNSYPDLSKVENQLRQHLRSPWVYTAVSKISRAAALVEIDVYRLNGEKKEPIDNHPIELLLRRPNPQMSGFNLQEYIVGSLNLAGNSYLYLANSKGAAQPDTIYPMRADRITIKPGLTVDKPVDAYIYTLGEIEVPLDPVQVIHFKRWHPLNDLYGLSPIEAMAVDLIGDEQMGAYNRNTFNSGRAVPAGVLNIKNAVTDAEFERIVKQWEKNHGGTQQKTAVISSAEVTFQPIGLSHKDLDFLAGRQFAKEEIFLAFGIPPGMLDKNATEANAQAGKEVFTNDTLWPQMVEICEQLTISLAPFWGDDLVIESADIRYTDQKADLQREMQEQPYITLNERRELEGRPPLQPVVLASGEIIDVGSMTAPIAAAVVAGGGGAPTQPTQPSGNPPASDISSSAAAKVTEPDFYTVKTVYTRRMNEELARFGRYAANGKDPDLFNFNNFPSEAATAAKALIDISDQHTEVFDWLKATPPNPYHKDDVHAAAKLKIERQIGTAISDYFDGLVNRLQMAARHESRASKAVSDDLLRRIQLYLDKQWWSDELDTLAGVMKPLIQDAVNTGAIDNADMLTVSSGITLDTSEFNTYAAQYALDYTDAVLKGFNSTTQDGVGAIIARYIGTPGTTLPDLIQAFQDSLLFGKYRARLFAVTETTRAFNIGQYHAAVGFAKSAGVAMLYAISMLPPLHPLCRCGHNDQFVYDDDGNIVGMDAVWLTANDDHVCELCDPRSGEMMSTL